ncbi:ABC transporter substrate-binding protein [Rhizocola hellebori]|uniref:ABC transporter substrate-binding protein n=1 Tax=Rhizocola hellebori TaxID=1392758 RepID=UPI001942FCD7|nr:ABC transporter substrate-binding protein [Rhizocola hellebori]
MALVLGATSVVLSGCTAADKTPPALAIGVLSATTGGDAKAGDDAVRGAQLAVEVVNDDHSKLPVLLGPGIGLPRLNGAKLTLVSVDTRGNPEEAARQSIDMVTQRHPVGVIVADSAQVAAATASEMQRLRVPLLDASGTADYLTELGLDWYFRTGPSDRLLTEGAFAMLRRELPAGAPKVALVAEAGGDSATGSSAVKEAAERSASSVVFEHEWQGGDSANAELIAKLKTSGAEAVVAWAHTAGGAAGIIRTVASATSRPVVGLGKGFRQLTQPPATGAMMLRSVAWSAEFATRSPAAQGVTQLYEKRFGHPMTDAAAAAFTSTIALAVAVDASGSQDTAAIRTALRQESLPPTQMIMPWNGVQFAADGHNSRAAGTIEAWEGTTYRVVHPAELAARPLRWPA